MFKRFTGIVGAGISVKKNESFFETGRLNRKSAALNDYIWNKEERLQAFTVKAELQEIGLTTVQTPFGHDVPVYDKERTICDVLRSRSRIKMQIFQEALKSYVRRKDKDLRTLMHYAQLFRVEKILRQYLEVLL